MPVWHHIDATAPDSYLGFARPLKAGGRSPVLMAPPCDTPHGRGCFVFRAPLSPHRLRLCEVNNLLRVPTPGPCGRSPPAAAVDATARPIKGPPFNPENRPV